jgi:hypothetical protein
MPNSTPTAFNDCGSVYYLRRSSLNCTWWPQYNHERPQSDDADGGQSRTKPPGRIRNAPDDNVERTRPEMNDRHASVAIRMPGVNRCCIIVTAQSCRICPIERIKLTAWRCGPPVQLWRAKNFDLCFTQASSGGVGSATGLSDLGAQGTRHGMLRCSPPVRCSRIPENAPMLLTDARRL